ncbi:cell division protein FtsQ/DivIB [Olivibacter sitiensis]|uniref:cell division protein FtsQ/DivIB n=1 Tax=Olivibacter sitiensis TaxID=376470 RepID=UPI001FE05BE9|nr:cell division protein FtsQ [Olivibacter sitiensis]
MSFISVKSSEQACNDLEIIIPGTQAFVSNEDVKALVKELEGDIIGRTLQSIEIHRIEHDIRQIPFVEEVKVFCDMDGKVRVKIHPREAVLRVINGMGSDFYIDRKGFKMPISFNYAPHIIVASGYIAERYNDKLDTMQTTLIRDLYKTADFINRDSLWEAQIEQLYVNNEQDIELVPRIGNQRIVLGNADSLEIKFTKLKLFYDRIVRQAGWQYYKTVNLKYANQIVCERNDDIIQEEIKKINTNSINTH